MAGQLTRQWRCRRRDVIAVLGARHGAHRPPGSRRPDSPRCPAAAGGAPSRWVPLPPPARPPPPAAPVGGTGHSTASPLRAIHDIDASSSVQWSREVKGTASQCEGGGGVRQATSRGHAKTSADPLHTSLLGHVCSPAKGSGTFSRCRVSRRDGSAASSRCASPPAASMASAPPPPAATPPLSQSPTGRHLANPADAPRNIPNRG